MFGSFWHPQWNVDLKSTSASTYAGEAKNLEKKPPIPFWTGVFSCTGMSSVSTYCTVTAFSSKWCSCLGLAYLY
jgi:hypothetical protein